MTNTAFVIDDVSMVEAQEVKGFSTPAVSALTGVRPTTLTSWTVGEHPLVQPSVLPSDGRRATRYWSARDLVIVRAIKALREAGCPLRQIRVAALRINEYFNGDLADTVLYWDGHDIIAVNSWGDIYSLIRHPGQQLIHVVALPLDTWRQEAEAHNDYKPVDVVEIELRRAKRREQRETPTVESLRLKS